MSEFKVLIVEDDRFISDMYLHTLEKAGFAVDVVVSGPEGIAHAKSGNYSVVLLDIMLPDKTGVEVLEELRGPASNAPTMRIIIMTNYNLGDSTREKMESMADGYLIKADITPSELTEIIANIQKEHTEH